MKRLRLALLGLAGSLALFAQSSPRAKAEVPFDFEMADRKFTAGEYHFDDLGARSAIRLCNSDITPLVFVLGNKDYEGTNDVGVVRLVFNRYGDRHFLAEVSYPDFTRRIFKSKNERALVTSKFIASRMERVIVLAKIF